MLVLDDLHWSDGASIELVTALIGRVPDAPVLLALGFRPAQADQRLCAAVATPPVRRLELHQLSQEEAALLLGRVDAESVAAIYRHGGGNPFYLEQLGRASGEDLAGRWMGRGRRAACPPRSGARSRESWSHCRRRRARSSTRRPSPASRSSRIWPR